MPDPLKHRQLHASSVAIGNKAILILGEPGAGKSDLSLRLIDRGAQLIADDQAELFRSGAKILVTSPETISGLIEVRGVGIFKSPAKKKVPLLLVVQLSIREWIERLPYPEPYNCMGVMIHQMRLCAFEESAPIKIEMAVAALKDGSMTVGAFKE